MPQDQLRDIIDNLRSRLQTELDAELASLASSHDEVLERTRREAEAQAEQQWAGRLEAVRADWSARLQTEVSAARAEAERQVVSGSMRARVDAEQAAAEHAAALRREMEQALALERARAQEAISAERERAERALTEARAALDAERQLTNDALGQARPGTRSLDTARLVAALRTIDEATSLTGVMRAVVGAATVEAPRAALFVLNGGQLDEWAAPGVPSMAAGSMRVDGRESGFLTNVLKRGEPIATGPGLTAPAFAVLGPDRQAFAVPFLLGGQPVAVLYADEGPSGQVPGGWADGVQILGRHAAAALACITARKTVEALRGGGERLAAQVSRAAASDEGEQGARRYARLLASEIKLYNEAAVRTGRQMRDLSLRLKPEIERARRLYDERVPSTLASRDVYFQQELVQALADGDPSLLG